MKGYYRYIFGLFFFRLMLESAFSQTYNFSVYSVDKGLAQSEVTCLMEDSRGFIWVGTAGGGICMFDGINFTCFEEKDGLSGQMISCVEEDRNGNILVGTVWGGISKYDGSKFINYTRDNGLLSDKVNGIASLNDGRVMIIYDNGISLMDNTGSINTLSDPRLSGSRCISVSKDNKGNAWVITDKNLFLFDGHALIDIKAKTDSSVFPVTCIRQVKDKYWLGTNGKGLYRLEIKNGSYRLEPFEKNSGLDKVDITSVITDERGELWFTTNGFGIARWNGKDLKFYNRQNGLPSSAIVNSIRDDQGNLWFGTTGGGLVKYSSGMFTYFDNVEGLKNNNVNSVLCAKDGSVWVAVPGHGLYRYDGVNNVNYSSDQGLLSNYVKTIYQDKEGIIWAGTSQGLNYFENNRLRVFEPGELKYIVRSVMKDSKGNLWIGTFGHGLLRYTGKKLERFENEKSLENAYVHSLLEDRKGNIWIGTGSGVRKYTDGKFIDFSGNSGFCNSYIGSIVEDKMGRIWFGTDRCIVKFDESDFHPYNENDGLSSNTVYSMIVDDKGNLWVGTNKGLDKIIFDEEGDIFNIYNYSATEGFRGIECNARCVSKDTSGNIYFGTVKGIIKYDPREEMNGNESIHLQITGIKLFLKETNLSKFSSVFSPWFNLPVEMRLPYDQNYVTFNYVGICHAVPEKVKYLCKLEGFDNDWVDNGNEHSMTYTNLPEGSYVFKVKAYTHVPNISVVSEYHFSVTAPFWRTWWFNFIVILLVLLLMYYVYNYRTKRIQLENERLEHHVAVRTNEILKQKKEIEILLQEIHHRVKNNLQIINSLISLQSTYIDEPRTLEIFEECKNRIITMSLIHERLYESKDFTRLDLKDYLGRLTSFLKSAYTINKPVHFDIRTNVDNFGIDTTIPIGLLVTEIVSNSLKYAFPGNSGGVIRIHLNRISDTQYELIAGDNGIGYLPDLSKESITFGLELIKILSDQLNGKIERLDEKGVVYRLVFEKIDKKTEKQP